MKRYLYNYQTIIRFTSPVSKHFFRLRCMPCVNACQQAGRRELFLHPSDYLTYDADSWGNPVQYGSRMEPHDSFVFVSSGEARLTPYAIPDAGSADMFRVPSALTALSPELCTLLEPPVPAGPPLDVALCLSQRVYDHMRYVPGTTQASTTAACAFGQREGVCQDYAHILLALCRAKGLAVRYANGFLQGIGETHAWVEVLDNGLWRGVDPTHNRLMEYGYIKLSHGRDAMDCPVNRGVFTGTAVQQTEVRVIVVEL